MSGERSLPGQMDLPFFSEEPDPVVEEAVEVGSFILSLRARGIRDTALLRAMELIPRDVFAPRRFADLSRSDVALPLPCGQTMTSPGAVASMVTALGVQEGQRVLEIGTGTGYVTALLARMGAEVHSVERFNTLAESAIQHLKIVELANCARLEIGDGLAQRVRERFDRILLNGAVLSIPSTVTSLLGPGGRLVGAVTIEGFPRLVRIDRLEDGQLRQELGAGLRLSPLVTGVAATL
ncbi:protein-L-isoaspartate O-methyltransferase family protein [Microvirga flavescens]|uniref:protein-L-isoaspartate O-methyltransferase family protein n=1 Tax=Microvirga flavescens TaxID=2249811 RepID=UPI001FE20CC7|nr:protein-L-isoaspartate O-methyltransferase [Microvirga flavescens]